MFKLIISLRASRLYCAASVSYRLSVFNVLDEEDLQNSARIVGDYMQDQFEELSKDYNCIGNIRGSGLFLGVDIVKNIESKEPDTSMAKHIINELKKNFILTGTDGPADNVIKIKPPLCFTRSNVDHLTNKLNDILIKR